MQLILRLPLYYLSFMTNANTDLNNALSSVRGYFDGFDLVKLE
jgi:hypothetical protein